jgi:membrane protease YdiL (CAAX protease family)
MLENLEDMSLLEPWNTVSRKREQVWEIAVFLFLIVPSMVFSFFVGRLGPVSFFLLATSTILRDLALVSLILFFIWRNGESLALIGWNLKNGWEDVFLGIGLFMPVFIGAGVLESFLKAIGFSAPAAPLPALTSLRSVFEITTAVVLFIVVALTEETIFRGYLILRFKGITGNFLAALLLSTVAFSLGHGYEGTAGIVTVFVLGLVYALIYGWRQSLLAPIIMHFLHDFTSLLLVISLNHHVMKN